VKVRILSPTPGSAQQYLTTFVVEDRVAIDAGCLGIVGEPEEQERIRHVFLTHIHLDHVATLPMFLQNTPGGGPVTAYGSPDLLEALRTDLFNGRLWPDYPLRGEGGDPALRLKPLDPEVPVAVAGLTVTPVPVDHVVNTTGYLVDDGTTVVAFGADSGPTDRIWQVARATGRWKGAFVEATFPDGLDDLAGRTGHLTPALFRGELAKFPPDVRVVAVHLSSRHRDRLAAELGSLEDDRVTVGTGGGEYDF